MRSGPIANDTPRAGSRRGTLDADARHAARAGDMQLEDFRKKVDRKVLEELKMTEEEYAEFLRAYEAMVQRQKAAAVEANQRGGKGSSAANTAAKRVQAGNAKPGALTPAARSCRHPKCATATRASPKTYPRPAPRRKTSEYLGRPQR